MLHYACLRRLVSALALPLLLCLPGPANPDAPRLQALKPTRALGSEGFRAKPFADPGLHGEVHGPYGHGSTSSQGQRQPRSVGSAGFQLPPGTRLRMTLDRTLSSATATRGQTAYGRLYNARTLGVPYGTLGEIVVLNAKPAERFFDSPGKLVLGINRLILPDGKSVWLRARLAAPTAPEPESNLERLGNTAGKAALGAGVGALGGLSSAAAADGDAGVGTAVGTAIGGGIGLVWAAVSKGQEVVLPAGSPLNVRLERGVVVRYR